VITIVAGLGFLATFREKQFQIDSAKIAEEDAALEQAAQAG